MELSRLKVDQRWMQQGELVDKLTLAAVGLLVLAGAVRAEVEEFRLGQLLEWLFDVGGFLFLDSLAALPDYLPLLGLLGVVALIVWVIKWRNK